MNKNNINRVKLINLVQQYPALYDTNHKDYHNFEIKERIWKDICKNLRCARIATIRMWKHLRKYYIEMMTKKVTEVGFTMQWELEDHMSFLFPFIEKKIKVNYLYFLHNEENNKESFPESEKPDNLEETKSQECIYMYRLKNIYNIDEYLASTLDIIAKWPIDKQIGFLNEVNQLIEKEEIKSKRFEISTRIKATSRENSQGLNGAKQNVTVPEDNNDDDDVILVENKPPEVIDIVSDDDQDASNMEVEIDNEVTSSQEFILPDQILRDALANKRHAS